MWCDLCVCKADVTCTCTVMTFTHAGHMSVALESRLWGDQVLFDALSILRELHTVAKATGRDDAKDRGGVSSRDQTQRDRDRERHPTKHPKLDAGHTHPLEAPPLRPHKGLTSSVSGLSKEKLWLAPSLRVRIVDRAYKKGLYYNSKVRACVRGCGKDGSFCRWSYLMW